MYSDKDTTSVSNNDIDLHALVNTFVTKQAPGILMNAAESARNLTDTIAYYDAFANSVAFTKNNDDFRPVRRRCPTLR